MTLKSKTQPHLRCGMMLYKSLPLPMLFLLWPTSGECKWVTLAERRSARSLVSLRDAWLNPKPAPGEPPISDLDLRKRTLTNLYNARPDWLANAHRTLDEAVLAAYGWPSSLTTQQILSNLLALNHQRAAAQPTK
jgi:hypothetical protein